MSASAPRRCSLNASSAAECSRRDNSFSARSRAAPASSGARSRVLLLGCRGFRTRRFAFRTLRIELGADRCLDLGRPFRAHAQIVARVFLALPDLVALVRKPAARLVADAIFDPQIDQLPKLVSAHILA